VKKLFIGGLIVLSVLASANAQTGATAAWEKDEKETFLGLTVFVRPQIMDIGSSVKSFFYDTNRGYTIEPPVKIARGKYSVRCVIGSEYTDDKVYLTFIFVRTSAADALIQSVLLQNSTRPGQQMTASTVEEIMYIMMTFFSAR
jgi:hypothetical protein